MNGILSQLKYVVPCLYRDTPGNDNCGTIAAAYKQEDVQVCIMHCSKGQAGSEQVAHFEITQGDQADQLGREAGWVAIGQEIVREK